MYNVFKRINTGGKPLVAQEIRHALNPGPAREFIRDLASSDEFAKATDHSVSPKRMADCECVLRFLAFRTLGLDNYGGKFDTFLTRAMRHLNQSSEKHAELRNDFIRAMSLAQEVFGRDAFRKPKKLGDKSRSPVNKALFESVSVALAEVPRSRTVALKQRREKIVEEFRRLIEDDPEFFNSISVRTSKTKHVTVRFARAREILRGIVP